MIRCPICATQRSWSGLEIVRQMNGQLEPYSANDSDVRRPDAMIDVYRRCPGTGDASGHLLPYAYADFGRPVTIGVIGAGTAGKSHLLAAMIAALAQASTRPVLGLRVSSLDFQIHERYQREVLQPFLGERRVLPITRVRPVEFTDALKVINTRTGRTHAVAFFDVGGEQLQNQDNPFLGALNALLFVVDGEAVRRHPRGQAPSLMGDPVSDGVLDRLIQINGRTPGGFLPLPAAVVLAKADLLQFVGERPVDEWLGQPTDEELDLSTLEQESLDVFRLLHRRGNAYLKPAKECLRTTLHFASASGVASAQGRFPERGFGPRRVLKPLLALFRVLDVLPDRRSEERA